MTRTEADKADNQARILRATVFGVIAGYVVLLTLLLTFSESRTELLEDMTSFLIIGCVGLALSIGPLLWPSVQNKMTVSGKGLWKSCAEQSLTPQRFIGLIAMGMMFGALLSQTVKLFAG